MADVKPGISKDMRLVELFEHYPESIPVLFSHGFQCMTCGQSMYETIEQGAFSHGYDHAALAELMDELQEAVRKAHSAEEKLALGEEQAFSALGKKKLTIKKKYPKK